MYFQFKWTRLVIVKGQQTIHHANISSPENKSISGTVLAWLCELSSLLSFLLDGPTSSFFVKGEKFGTTCSKGKNMLRYYLFITCYPLSDTLYAIRLQIYLLVTFYYHAVSLWHWFSFYSGR